MHEAHGVHSKSEAAASATGHEDATGLPDLGHECGELVVLQAVHRSGKLLLEQAQAGGNARIGWFVGQRVSCR